MAGAQQFLGALATVLCVAAATTVLFQALRQPVVLGYLLAGLIVGPYLALPLVANPNVIRTLSELGVILLMFSLGLEFSMRKVLRLAGTSGLTAVIECSLMIWLGYVVARAFGWSQREAIFTGSLIAISSTTIIAKTFGEQGIRGKLRDVVLGVLVVEDLIAILLLATLTALATGRGLSADALARAMVSLAAFLVGVVVVGLAVIPRAVRAIVRLRRPETTLVAVVGICFAIALLARASGYSVALGAFLAGALVAESGHVPSISRLVDPVRDVFAAIFFVSVGMLINPESILQHLGGVVALVAAVVAGKILAVSVGAFLTGHGTRISLQAGMSLAQIGEFSFIIASLGASLNATHDFLYPVAVSVSAVTTLFTPSLVRASGHVAAYVDRKLPAPLQTFSALYASWVESVRSARGRTTLGRTFRRIVPVLLLDAAILAAVVIGASMLVSRATAAIERSAPVPARAAKALVVAVAAAMSLPLCIGILRNARKLGEAIAGVALPTSGRNRADLAAAPRRALVITLQFAIVLLIGFPLLAITQPFVPLPGGAAVLVVTLLVLGIALWRSAANLQGHVRAGAEMIVEALATAPPPEAEDALQDVRELLPGLGEPEPFQLEPTSSAIGKTLAQLNLRGLTGATVLAIQRGSRGVIVPSAHEVLQQGDVLALAGTHEAIEAAIALLRLPAP